MNWKIRQIIDLARPDAITTPDVWVSLGDRMAHTWEVSVRQDGAAVDLTGATASAYVLRDDGSTVLIEGVATGNVATVVLPQECYAATTGNAADHLMSMRIALGGATLTMAHAVLHVRRDASDAVVDPGAAVPNIGDLLAAVPGAAAATAAANAAAESANDVAAGLSEQQYTVRRALGASYQYIRYAEIIAGEYYDHGSSNTMNSTTAGRHPPIPIRAGATYRYSELYHYFCALVYDNGTTVALSESPDNNHASGTFVAADDGWLYVTVAVDAGVPVTGAMLCDGPVPPTYIEGMYDYDQAIRTRIVTVKPSGGDYSNLRTCFETIAPSYHDRYIVEIYEGSYEVNAYYTPAEWAVESPDFVGLRVPDYVTLRGVGRRDYIKLFAWDTVDRQYISTLNFCNTAAIENIRVEGTHLRYTIHDDGAWETGVERRVKNCHFVGQYLALSIVYGSGCKSGADWKFENCIFEHLDNGPAFTNHNNTGWDREANITLDNCRFLTADPTNAIRFGSLNAGANGMITNVTMRGCKCPGALHLMEENASLYGAGILFKVTGYGNSFGSTQITNTDGLDYSGNIDLI